MNATKTTNGIVLDIDTAATVANAIMRLALDAAALRPCDPEQGRILSRYADEVASHAWKPENLGTAHGALYEVAEGLEGYRTRIRDYGINENTCAMLERVIAVLAPGCERDFLSAALAAVRELGKVQDNARETQRAANVVDGSDMALARRMVSR